MTGQPEGVWGLAHLSHSSSNVQQTARFLRCDTQQLMLLLGSSTRRLAAVMKQTPYRDLCSCSYDCGRGLLLLISCSCLDFGGVGPAV